MFWIITLNIGINKGVSVFFRILRFDGFCQKILITDARLPLLLNFGDFDHILKNGL